MQDVICQIIRRAYFAGPELVLPQGVRAADVYAELQAQAIQGLALVPGSLADACGDAGLAADMANLDLRRRALALHLLDVQDDVLATLDAAGLPAVILKGTAAGMYYDDPLARSYGDVDVMVPPRLFDRALAALIAAGFAVDEADEGAGPEGGIDRPGGSSRHVGLEKAGVRVELHWGVNGIPRADHGRIRGLFEDGLAHAQTARVAGHTFPALPTMVNGVLLLIHARKHLAGSGLGFRQIIDWMLFARRHLAGAGWDEFARLLGNDQLVRTACCLTRFCQLYLGMPQEGFGWCAQAEPEACALLMEHVMMMGNFGRKLDAVTDGKTGAYALSRARTPLQFVRNMQESGLASWHAAREHAWLRPFAWLYQGCRYVRIALTRPGALRHMRVDIEETARRRKVFEELGLYDR